MITYSNKPGILCIVETYFQIYCCIHTISSTLPRQQLFFILHLFFIILIIFFFFFLPNLYTGPRFPSLASSTMILTIIQEYANAISTKPDNAKLCSTHDTTGWALKLFLLKPKPSQHQCVQSCLFNFSLLRPTFF